MDVHQAAARQPLVGQPARLREGGLASWQEKKNRSWYLPAVLPAPTTALYPYPYPLEPCPVVACPPTDAAGCAARSLHQPRYPILGAPFGSHTQHTPRPLSLFHFFLDPHSPSPLLSLLPPLLTPPRQAESADSFDNPVTNSSPFVDTRIPVSRASPLPSPLSSLLCRFP